jgi:hypothetical protein
MIEQEHCGKSTSEAPNVRRVDQVNRDWWFRLNIAVNVTSDFARKVGAASLGLR